MQGLHLTADLFQCACRDDLLTDRGTLQESCIRLVRQAGLTVVGDDFHQFADPAGEASGVTGLVLLAESHLAVHTWPELDAVTLDVYVCNFRQDNTSKAQMLTDNAIPGSRIKVVTDNGIVYLMGLLTQAEATRAANLVQGVS